MTPRQGPRSRAVATAAGLLLLASTLRGCRSSSTTDPGAVLSPPPSPTAAAPVQPSRALPDDGAPDEPGGVRAMTADGARVAFTRRTGEHDELELVIVGRHGSEAAAWPAHEAGHEELSLASLAWDPSGRRLAFTLRSASGTEVRVLPVDRDGTLRGASEVVAPTSANATLEAAAFRTPRVVTVAERCCATGDTATWRLLDVDLETGSSKELATGLDHAVTDLDWDPDQQRMVVELDTEPPSRMSWTDGVLEPIDRETATAVG